MMMQLTLASQMRMGYGSEGVSHDVFLSKFPSQCSHPKWTSGEWANLQEQVYGCPDQEENGCVYVDLSGKWLAYGYLIDEKRFNSSAEAKSYIEQRVAYWSRPKAPWWKFWKEFDDSTKETP